VEARLTGDADSVLAIPVRFGANLSVARRVAYDPSDCPLLEEQGVDTVQAAIDALCRIKGIRIERVELAAGRPLQNDTEVPAAALADGIQIVCDNPIDPAALSARFGNSPVCFVTLELPYPHTQTDRSFWGLTEFVGFQPLKLAAEVSAEGNSIVWRPIDQTSSWLRDLLFQPLRELGVEGILARLTLKGNFIWEQTEEGDPQLRLDGDVFGQPDGNRTGINLPSGDGRRGGDLEMWFWLLPG
jgi:hypothetical protein